VELEPEVDDDFLVLEPLPEGRDRKAEEMLLLFPLIPTLERSPSSSSLTPLCLRSRLTGGLLPSKEKVITAPSSSPQSLFFPVTVTEERVFLLTGVLPGSMDGLSLSSRLVPIVILCIGDVDRAVRALMPRASRLALDDIEDALLVTVEAEVVTVPAERDDGLSLTVR